MSGDSAEEQARRLAAESLAAGDPTGWFERLYATAERSGTGVPWDRGSPTRLLVDWARTAASRGSRALVVGSGLGDDAEHVASLGYDTTAFDIAPSAVLAAQRRFPASAVHYLAADLLDAPARWRHAFDLVVESITVQAMPVPLHERAARAVASFIAPGGTLLVIASGRDPGDGEVDGPPWPLTRDEITAFAGGGVEVVGIEQITDEVQGLRWRATFRRSGA